MHHGQDPNYIANTEKRYFVVDSAEYRARTNSSGAISKLTFPYPPEFIESGNRKYVHVINVYLFIEDPDDNTSYSCPNAYSIHGSFVQDADYLDHYICFANSPIYKRKKYEQFSATKSFSLWFTDYSGTHVDLPTNGHVVVELMLEY